METEAIRVKYDPRVYLQRMAAKSLVDRFLKSESTALLLLGKSGVGKSNFLLSLLEDYIDIESTAILMLDAARLPVQNQLDFTLAKMISEVANLPRDFMDALERDLWGEDHEGQAVYSHF
jgi:DNA replication protein DnaC